MVGVDAHLKRPISTEALKYQVRTWMGEPGDIRGSAKTRCCIGLSAGQHGTKRQAKCKVSTEGKEMHSNLMKKIKDKAGTSDCGESHVH